MKRVIVFLSSFVLALAPVPVSAQDASLAADGWWNIVHDYSLLTDLLGGPSPVAPPAPPTNVPADGLATSHSGTEVDKIAAVLLFLDVPFGAQLVEARLVLPEHPDPGSSFGTGTVSACAATGPWGAVRNGDWNRRPDFDCEISSPGTRSEDGVWTFDLAPIAEQWLDGSLLADGVVFVVTETVEPTQVVFQDISSPEVGLVFETGAPPEEEDVPTAPPPAIGAPVQPPPLLAAPIVEAPAPAPPAPTILEVTPAQAQPEIIIDPNVLGNLPPTTLVLIPLLLGGGALVSYVLGPAGTPQDRTTRAGAVSRTLGSERVTDRPEPVRRLGAVSRTLEGS